MGLINKIFKQDEEQEANKAATTQVTDADVKVEPEEKKKVVKASSKGHKKSDKDAFRVLMHPVITEKAADLAQLNKYVFAVPMNATKSEVIKKIKNVYGVNPVKVNMVMKIGKIVRRGRTAGQQVSWKKAIVTLPANEKIEIYEGV